MTPKSFFMIVIRVIGIFMLFNTLANVPTVVLYLSNMIEFAPTVSFLFFIIGIILLLYLEIILLIKPETVIKLLKLDTGFEEETFQLNKSLSIIVLRVSVIVIGGITLLFEIPEFLQNLFIFWQQKSIKWQEHPDTKNLIYSALIIIIAYLLIYYNGKIVAYIEKQSKEKDI